MALADAHVRARMRSHVWFCFDECAYKPPPPQQTLWRTPRSTSGPGLWWRMSHGLGVLAKAGYTSAATGLTQRFPIVFGETGAKFENVRGAAR